MEDQHRPGHWCQGNTTPTVSYAGGPEATCGTAQIDKTYVSVNQYRRASDNLYYNINNGTITDRISDPDGDLVWCSAPTRFRYYLNSAINPAPCSG